MSVLADINEMEERIDELLVGVEDRIQPATDRYRRAVVEAVLQVLDDYDLAELAEADLRRILDDALADLTPQLQESVQQSISQQLEEMLTVTRDFYTALEIDPPGVTEAVRRSREVSQLTAFLEDGMDLADDELKEETIDVLTETITRGEIDRSAIREEIIDRTGAAERTAYTQARTSLSGYNQVYRNELASRAELGHHLYYGSLQSNSRAFCRLHKGGVYTDAQISRMDNGMLNPVKVFQGGYNCRHSWVPVDPSWSEELQDKVVESGGTASVPLDQSGDRTLSAVVGNAATDQRRLRQATLRAEGYTDFIDAETSDEGFVALHRSWKNHFEKFDPGHPERDAMQRELDAGLALSEKGDEALYNRTLKNLKGTGNVDVVWNGRNTEIKTPTKFHAGALSRPLDPSQSNHFLLALRKQIRDEDQEEARRRLKNWRIRNPDKGVSILHYYDGNRLEETTE